MRLTRKSILALAAVSFLTITISGLHLHADVGGHGTGVTHTQDLHQDLVSDLDHESEHVDVSVFEPARGFSNVETFALALTIPALVSPAAADISWSKNASIILPRRYWRLRLPVRAPPVSI